MSDGSGIVIGCEMCGKIREFTVAEISSAATPSLAAENILASEGWDIAERICEGCVAAIADTPPEEADDVGPPDELPQRQRTIGMRVIEGGQGAGPDRDDKPAPQPRPRPNELVHEGHDVRVILTEYSIMDEKGERMVPALFVERAKRDGMGNPAWVRVTPGQEIWVIQSLVRLIYELVRGEESPERVHLGKDKYLPGWTG